MKRTHQFLIYSRGAKFLWDSVNATRKITEIVINAGMEVETEVNRKETKYKLMYHYHSEGQTRSIK